MNIHAYSCMVDTHVNSKMLKCPAPVTLLCFGYWSFMSNVNYHVPIFSVFFAPIPLIKYLASSQNKPGVLFTVVCK